MVISFQLIPSKPTKRLAGLKLDEFSPLRSITVLIVKMKLMITITMQVNVVDAKKNETK